MPLTPELIVERFYIYAVRAADRLPAGGAAGQIVPHRAHQRFAIIPRG